MSIKSEIKDIKDKIDDIKSDISLKHRLEDQDELMIKISDVLTDLNFLNDEIDKIIQEESYRLIRRKARDMINNASNEELGSYTKGVVDLQTELYNSLN